MTGLDSHSVPEGAREALVLWTNQPAFHLLMAIIRHRIAVAVAEQTAITLRNADSILRSGVESPGVEKAIRDAAKWTIIYDAMMSLQAELANGEVPILTGNKLEI